PRGARRGPRSRRQSRSDRAPPRSRSRLGTFPSSEAGEHLVECPEGLALEAPALGGRGEAERRVDGVQADVGEARVGELVREHPRRPRLNGPGTPGPGAGSPARRRMTDAGMEKNAFRSGVE